MFNKEKSTILKGVAILLMMWHHCFLEGRFDGYDINFWPLSENQIINIANACKICVSLFAFVSGYGLFLSFRNHKTKKLSDNVPSVSSDGGWIIERLCRTLSGYWFIVVLCWIVCMILDQRPVQVYGFSKSAVTGVLNMLSDFTGLGHILGTNKLIETWWYMSAAIVFIVFVPLLYKSISTLGCICTAGLVYILPRIVIGFPGGVSLWGFLLIFCFGMIFASQDLFKKWSQFWERKTSGRPVMHILKFALMLLALLVSYKLYYYLPFMKFWEIKWAVLPLSVIMFVNDYIANIPVLNRVLAFLGKHSMNIFLVHSFVRVIYCEDLVYNMPHFTLTILVLLLISLAISIIIEQLKKLLRYDKLINKLIVKVRKCELN